MAATSTKRILLIEDDPAVRSVCTRMLRDAGFLVTAIDLAERAFDPLRSERPDLVVLDLGMPVGTLQGIDFLTALREEVVREALPVVILSGLGDVVNPDVMRRLKVAAVFGKPLLDRAQFIAVIRRLVS